jgi:hypothetical protein
MQLSLMIENPQTQENRGQRLTCWRRSAREFGCPPRKADSYAAPSEYRSRRSPKRRETPALKADVIVQNSLGKAFAANEAGNMDVAVSNAPPM